MRNGIPFSRYETFDFFRCFEKALGHWVNFISVSFLKATLQYVQNMLLYIGIPNEGMGARLRIMSHIFINGHLYEIGISNIALIS